MRLNFRKLTTAASVAVVSALAWSGSVQAPPQILGLVASNGPIPLKCDSYYCAAEFTTFCLQQERKGAPRNHVYHAHNGGEGIRILGPKATGEVVEMANGSALEIIAPRGQTVVNMSVPKRMLDKFGVTKVAIEIAPNVSLLPQEKPNDYNAQSEQDIAIATGPLRELGTKLVDQNKAKVAAADVLNRVITLLPEGNRAASTRLRNSVWEKVAASLPKDDVYNGAITDAKQTFDSCHVHSTGKAFTRSTSVTGRNSLSLRNCLTIGHDELISPLNKTYWEAVKFGS